MQVPINTIITEITKPLINLKKMLKPGNIIVIEINKEVIKEIELILNYIESRGYTITPLEEGLKE